MQPTLSIVSCIVVPLSHTLQTHFSRKNKTGAMNLIDKHLVIKPIANLIVRWQRATAIKDQERLIANVDRGLSHWASAVKRQMAEGAIQASMDSLTELLGDPSDPDILWRIKTEAARQIEHLSTATSFCALGQSEKTAWVGLYGMGDTGQAEQSAAHILLHSGAYTNLLQLTELYLVEPDTDLAESSRIAFDRRTRLLGPCDEYFASLLKVALANHPGGTDGEILRDEVLERELALVAARRVYTGENHRGEHYDGIRIAPAFTSSLCN